MMTIKEQQDLVLTYFPGGKWAAVRDIPPDVTWASASLQGEITFGERWGFDFPHLNALSEADIRAIQHRQDYLALDPFEASLIALKMEVLQTKYILGLALGLTESTPQFDLVFPPAKGDADQTENIVTLSMTPRASAVAGVPTAAEWRQLPGSPQYVNGTTFTIPPMNKLVLICTPDGVTEAFRQTEPHAPESWWSPNGDYIPVVYAWTFLPEE